MAGRIESLPSRRIPEFQVTTVSLQPPLGGHCQFPANIGQPICGKERPLNPNLDMVRGDIADDPAHELRTIAGLELVRGNEPGDRPVDRLDGNERFLRKRTRLNLARYPDLLSDRQRHRDPTSSAFFDHTSAIRDELPTVVPSYPRPGSQVNGLE